MKLGEAKKQLEQISLRLVENKAVLAVGPRAGIVATLDECTDLLRKRQLLQKQIAETEAMTALEGNTLVDVQSVSEVLRIKVNLLKILTERNDLDEETKKSLFEQLRTHRNSKHGLELSIQCCLWETELVE